MLMAFYAVQIDLLSLDLAKLSQDLILHRDMNIFYRYRILKIYFCSICYIYAQK